MLATSEAFCEYAASAQMLASVLGGGVIEEISAADYFAEMPSVSE
jgi:hypothetical protein